jgi:hypothetical protein
VVKINSIEDIFYKEGDIIPSPPRTYTEEEEAQNIEDEKLMAEVDMEGWAYERSYRHEDYDDLGDMLADGIDIDDIPESYYSIGNSKPREPLGFPATFIKTVPDVEEDIIHF